MNKMSLTFAGLLLVGVSATVQAQGPLYDKVTVDLPYRVTLNNTVLEPGHYTIRQLDSPGGGSRVLQIFTNGGMRLKTSTLTIPTLDNRTPSSTRVILHHYGSDYYFDKIWVQGKDYGYEFPLPPAVKSRERERMEPYTVAAIYEQTPAANQAGSNETDTTTVTQAAPAPTPAPAAVAEAPAPAVVADNSAPVNSAPAPDTTTNNTPAPRMPHTAGNWLGLLLSGGALTSAGAMLRRFRS